MVTAYLVATTVVLLIGLVISIIIFFSLAFGKYHLTIMAHWNYIGPIFAITHLLTVGLVAYFIFDDLVSVESSDIGAISHRYGWFGVATACFPVGYPVGLFCFKLNKYLTDRFEHELKGCSGDRIVYNGRDLLGYIPFGRIWIPSILFGIFGGIYWYKLPMIIKWILS